VFDKNLRATAVDESSPLEVFDDGIPQPQAECKRQSAKLSVTIAVDASSSMGSHLQEIRSQLAGFLKALPSTDTVTVLRFERNIRSLVAGESPATATEKLFELKPGGPTALWDNVARAAQWLSNSDPTGILFVLTDGGDQLSVPAPDAAIRRLKPKLAGVHVKKFPGERVGPQTKRGFDELARGTYGTVEDVRAVDRLGADMLRQVSQLRSLYHCGFQPQGDPDGREHALRVVVKGRPDLSVNHQRSYKYDRR
jgi:hypothetical protein